MHFTFCSIHCCFCNIHYSTIVINVHICTYVYVYSLMFHTLLIQRLSFVLVALPVTLTFACGMKFYYFNNHFTTIMQGCYNCTRLRTPCTNYHNLVTTLSQPYKVAARLLQPSYFRKGMFCC